MNEIDLLKGKILYERIVILAPLISAGLVLLGTLFGAIIGARATAWVEKRKHKQVYMERILSILEEALANYTLCVSYAFMSEPMGVDKFRELENRLSEFQDRHPLLPFQIKVIDEKLYNSLNDIYMFHMKTSISKAGVEERKRIASELKNKIQKCQQRICEVWSE